MFIFFCSLIELYRAWIESIYSTFFLVFPFLLRKRNSFQFQIKCKKMYLQTILSLMIFRSISINYSVLMYFGIVLFCVCLRQFKIKNHLKRTLFRVDTCCEIKVENYTSKVLYLLVDIFATSLTVLFCISIKWISYK